MLHSFITIEDMYVNIVEKDLLKIILLLLNMRDRRFRCKFCIATVRIKLELKNYSLFDFFCLYPVIIPATIVPTKQDMM